MPRTARLKGPDCTYHIIIRGNNKEKIFYQDLDKTRFLNTLRKFKLKYNFLLYAYVLMDNHVHMIINSNGEDISKIMQSISISYTYYINKKYDRVGHLFQDRFKSIIINEDSYIINLSKYIHNNPKRAQLVQNASDYRWSSCRLYTKDCEDEFEIVDTDMILNYFSSASKSSKTLYSNFMEDEEENAEEKAKEKITTVPNYNKMQTKNMQKIDARVILKAVSEKYRLPVDDLLMKYNRRHSEIRNECIYIVRLKSGQNNRNIGKLFGGICDSTVSYAIGKVVEKIMNDEEVLKRINNLISCIAY